MENIFLSSNACFKKKNEKYLALLQYLRILLPKQDRILNI